MLMELCGFFVCKIQGQYSINTNQEASLHLHISIKDLYARVTVELQWLEHLWKHENMFETGVVRANEY